MAEKISILESKILASYEWLATLYKNKIIESYETQTYEYAYAATPATLKPRVAELLTEAGYGFLVTE